MAKRFDDIVAVGQSRFISSIGQLLQRLRPERPERLRFPVRRPDDLLVFDLLFENLQVESNAEQGVMLKRIDPAKPGILIIEFPPQSFGEEAFLGEQSKVDTKPDDIKAEGRTGITATKVNEPLPTNIPVIDLVRVRMSGASRVAFVMEPAITEIAFTLEAILNAMSSWPMNLDSNALPDIEDTQSHFVLHTKIIGQLRKAVTEHITLSEQPEFNNTLNSALQRITNESVGGLANAAQQQLGEVILKGVLREAEMVFNQHPALREGDLHFATLATLALESANNLSDAARELNLTINPNELVENLPFVNFLSGFPREPSLQVTALELPYRLILTPIESARWRHSILPRVAQGLTELWHTRLTTSSGVVDVDASAKVRAIWSPDYPLDDAEIAAKVNKPFRMSLDTQDRKMLVNLMGNYRQKRRDTPLFNYIPRASVTKRLQLSSLGGLLDLEGEWSHRPVNVDLEQWRHLATLGRDHYVRVVYSGFLLPFGHAASLVKVTERKFEGEPGNRVALLRQRFFIVVRERVRTYDGTNHEFDARNFPFTEVEVLTRITPDLAEPVKFFGDAPITARMAFWPTVPVADLNKKEFRFEVTALDRDNQRVSFSLPMLFISEIVNHHHSAPARKAYNESDLHKHRETNMLGASVRFDKNSADSTLATHLISFDLGGTAPSGTITPPSATKPNFHPQVERVQVGVPALQKLVGRKDLIVMQYPDVVKNNLLNEGKVFLAVLENNPARLEFGGGGNSQQTDSLGGLVSPQMEIYGLSTVSGLVASQAGQTLTAALAKAVDNKFDPADYFSPDAKIIGGISLRDLFDAIAPVDLNDPRAPQLLSRETPAEVVTSFDWTIPFDTKGNQQLLIPRSSTVFTMHGQTIIPFANPAGAVRSAHAALTEFKLNLFGCIILNFDKLAFTVNPGQKPDVSVQLNAIDAVRFGGPLEFINELREFIPSNGFSDPPALSVTPSGISASYSLGLPAIGVGIFSLSNVTLGAGFNLPFDNRPVSVRFNFAERQRPFSLTVSLLGGGGFFAVTLSSKGVQEIEAALEFGAAISLKLVVASGMVEIKAGVYFNWKDDSSGKRVVLAGYVRIHGELTILCIFSASLTFNLQLAYENNKASGKGAVSIVYGEAEIIVDVEIVFVSFSVAVRCRKEFGGGVADPKFLDLMNENSWNDYCAAFAPETV